MTLEDRIANWVLEIFIGYINEFNIEHALEILRVANRKSFFILKPELIDVQKYIGIILQRYFH